MKTRYFALSSLALVAIAGAALAQVPPLPTVSAVHSTDKIAVLPYGSPGAPTQFATIAQILSATGSTSNASGLPGAPLPLIGFKNSDGTTLAATAAAGKFGLAITAGTSEDLISEAANSNTKTDVAGVEVVLPSSYVAGSNITVTANCQYTLGSGTVGTHTLAAAAYLTAPAGTQGSTIIATAAQTVPAAAGTVTFTISGAGLTANSRLWLTFTLVIQDTGGSNITAQVNSVTLS